MIIQGTAITGTTVSSSAATVDADSYFNLVSLLLPGNGTNGQTNNTFLDSSTNAFTITRNGNTTQGTFSPFSQTGWSNYFDGTGDKLSLSSSTAFGFGTGDFTIELWVFCSFNGAVQEFIDGRAVDDNIPWVLGINGTGLARTYDGTTIRASGQLNQNAWNHVAWVRASNVNTVYVNGVSVQTWTASQDFGSTKPLTIANNVGPTSEPFTGYISNLRIVKGTAVYTSAFTPSTTPLTAVSGTSLLTCQSNRFIDNSTNAFAITVSGNPSVQAFAPFNPTASYSAATVGGSAYFDGSGDYLQNTSITNQFDVDSGFTLEFWTYSSFYPESSGYINVGGSTVNWNATTGLYWSLFRDGSNLQWQTNLLNGLAVNVIATTAPPTNTWTHIAIGYNGTTTRMWVNGTSVGTSTQSYGKPSGTDRIQVGAFTGGVAPYFGYFSEIRFVKGTDVYGVGNTSITVPTAPLTAISGTSLLLSATNGGITDATAKNVLETVGSAQISTAQSKWGGSSMAFDGNGDFLIAQNNPALQLGSDNFTIDGWFNLSAHVYQNWSICSKGSEWALIGDANRWVFQVNAAVNPFVIAWTPVYNIWYHFACVRNGSTTTMYINGNSIGSGTSANITNSTGVLRVGRYGTDATYDINGYIQDLRITKGVARYTANFTPPTQAFPTQ